MPGSPGKNAHGGQSKAAHNARTTSGDVGNKMVKRRSGTTPLQLDLRTGSAPKEVQYLGRTYPLSIFARAHLVRRRPGLACCLLRRPPSSIRSGTLGPLSAGAALESVTSQHAQIKSMSLGIGLNPPARFGMGQSGRNWLKAGNASWHSPQLHFVRKSSPGVIPCKGDRSDLLRVNSFEGQRGQQHRARDGSARNLARFGLAKLGIGGPTPTSMAEPSSVFVAGAGFSGTDSQRSTHAKSAWIHPCPEPGVPTRSLETKLHRNVVRERLDRLREKLPRNLCQTLLSTRKTTELSSAALGEERRSVRGATSRSAAKASDDSTEPCANPIFARPDFPPQLGLRTRLSAPLIDTLLKSTRATPRSASLLPSHLC